LGTSAAPPSEAERRTVEATTAHSVDALVHRGCAVDRALSGWQSDAATVGRRVFLPEHADPALITHELHHVLQAGNRDVDLKQDVSLGPATAAEERMTTAYGGSSPQVLRRRPKRVATPPWPPAPTPPAFYAPTGDRHDAEGNPVNRTASGAWYLASPPTLTFPIARGHRHQLLPLNPNSSFAALRDECIRVRDEQEKTAKRLKGNGKYWFARVYYYVTVHELANIDRGVYQYPHMKMQEVIHFNNTYAANLAAWENNQRNRVEPNWRAAFGAAESSSSWLGTSWTVKNALLPSIEAHIRFDLPRAIAAVYKLHYADLPDASISEFRADFFAMASVFDRASEDLSVEIDDAGSDKNPFKWQPPADVIFPFVFSVPLEREMAWEKAIRIASSGGSSAATERRLHSSLTAAHPNLEPFEVDGNFIRGYDWQHQPGIRPDTQPGPTQLPAPPPPPVPRRLYFRLNRPNGDLELADAVRADQDVYPLLRLAAWLRRVSGAVIILSGHASSEGAEHTNANLSAARTGLVEYFLFRAGADLRRNTIVQLPEGERGASATPAWRYVEITVPWRGFAKHTVWSTARGLPSEVH
jgi:hypothetical protein